MAKVFFERKWFEELSPNSVYETAYETMVKAHAEHLWPRFHAVKFKTTVSAPEGNAKADFALIERSYNEWWVVEVELDHHLLNSHVIPQVRKLATALYGADVAKKLCEGNPELDLIKVTNLLKDQEPKVLVVVNKPKPDWVEPLSKLNAKLAIFEIFRSKDNQHLFRVNGEHPVGRSDVISVCKFTPLMNRCLLIETPAGLSVQPQGKIPIQYKDHLTEWERLDVDNKVWLLTSSPNPLSEECNYELVRLGDGRFMFQETLK